MKVKNRTTGVILESENEMIVQSWENNPDFETIEPEDAGGDEFDQESEDENEGDSGLESENADGASSDPEPETVIGDSPVSESENVDGANSDPEPENAGSDSLDPEPEISKKTTKTRKAVKANVESGNDEKGELGD